MTSSQVEYHLYILLCDEKILYTGIALNPEQRLEEHIKGYPLGAKFTRRFKQLEIIYQVKVGDRSQAQSLEFKIKKLNRKKKLALVSEQADLPQLLSLLNSFNKTC